MSSYNRINLKPVQIGVLGSNHWSQKDTSHIEDFQTIEKKMDWTFCTPYKGTYHSHSPDLTNRLRIEMGLSQA